MIRPRHQLRTRRLSVLRAAEKEQLLSLCPNQHRRRRLPPTAAALSFRFRTRRAILRRSVSSRLSLALNL